MVKGYFDFYSEEEPLALVFAVSRQLINFHEALSDEQLLNLAEKFGRAYRFWQEIWEEKNIKRAREMFRGSFGRGNVLLESGGDTDFIFFKAIIPSGAIYYEHEVCPDCQGTKINPIYDRPCQTCYESGFKTGKNPKLRSLLAENLCLFLRWIDFLTFNCKTTHERPLLMFVQTNNGGYGNQDVFGFYTKEFANYLDYVIDAQKIDDLKKAVSLIMQQSYSWLCYGKKNTTYDKLFKFPVIIDRREHGHDIKPFFSVQVPGQNGCHVYSYDTSCAYAAGDEDKIFSMTCHNIDSPSQQISLLVGLAYLSRAARQ